MEAPKRIICHRMANSFLNQIIHQNDCYWSMNLTISDEETCCRSVDIQTIWSLVILALAVISNRKEREKLQPGLLASKISSPVKYAFPSPLNKHKMQTNCNWRWYILASSLSMNRTLLGQHDGHPLSLTMMEHILATQNKVCKRKEGKMKWSHFLFHECNVHCKIKMNV